MLNIHHSHIKQQRIWEEEHKNPKIFPFLDSNEPNLGVVEFFKEFLCKINNTNLSGLEICCGKGRNTLWLANQNIKMHAFDFSKNAIKEAISRLEISTYSERIFFSIADAIQEWPYEDHQFDFIIDCFGSSDIESFSGRKFVLDQAVKCLKPGGLYFLQIDSPELGIFKELFEKNPGIERNTLIFNNGKVESFLTESDILNWDHDLKIIKIERFIDSSTEINGKTMPYKYFRIVAQSPFI